MHFLLTYFPGREAELDALLVSKVKLLLCILQTPQKPLLFGSNHVANYHTSYAVSSNDFLPSLVSTQADWPNWFLWREVYLFTPSINGLLNCKGKHSQWQCELVWESSTTCQRAPGLCAPEFYLIKWADISLFIRFQNALFDSITKPVTIPLVLGPQICMHESHIHSPTPTGTEGLEQMAVQLLWQCACMRKVGSNLLLLIYRSPWLIRGLQHSL